MKALTLQQLVEVWNKILKDKGAQQALATLAKDGFRISHLSPRDPSLRNPCWVDYIATIPFVPNRPSRTRFYRKTSLQKHWPLVRVMRRFAVKLDDPFCEMGVALGRHYSVNEDPSLGKRMTEASELIEKLLSWNWYTREKNPRNALIACLRWQIRERTKKPHDKELLAIISAAFRATGKKEGFYLTPNALDRIEKREKESRVRAASRFRSWLSTEPALY